MILVPLTLEEANRFVLKHHRHNKPVVGHRFSIGLELNLELVGVAIVGRPNSRMLQASSRCLAEVLRVCTIPRAQKGACSKLYAACWRAWRSMGGTKLITYTLKSESGASMRGAGWKVIAETKGGQWDREARPRTEQDIYNEPKFRWEIAANEA